MNAQQYEAALRAGVKSDPAVFRSVIAMLISTDEGPRRASAVSTLGSVQDFDVWRRHAIACGSGCRAAVPTRLA